MMGRSSIATMFADLPVADEWVKGRALLCPP